MDSEPRSKHASGLSKAVEPAPPVSFSLDDFTDYVAFHRKCDTLAHDGSTIPEKMSLKKCRFCD